MLGPEPLHVGMRDGALTHLALTLAVAWLLSPQPGSHSVATPCVGLLLPHMCPEGTCQGQASKRQGEEASRLADASIQTVAASLTLSWFIQSRQGPPIVNGEKQQQQKAPSHDGRGGVPLQRACETGGHGGAASFGE